MKNRRMLIFFTLVLATGLFAFLAFNPKAQNSNPQQDKEEATIVKRGQTTDKEREYRSKKTEVSS